jgi:hypothetical protein
MTAQVAQGKLTAKDAASAADKQFKDIFRKWRDQKMM